MHNVHSRAYKSYLRMVIKYRRASSANICDTLLHTCTRWNSESSDFIFDIGKRLKERIHKNETKTRGEHRSESVQNVFIQLAWQTSTH